MIELRLRLALLLSSVVEAATASGTEFSRLRGTALYDSQKDLFITSLKPFASVEESVRESRLVQERYGAEQSRRIALQLVYEYFARAGRLAVDAAVVDTVWADFVAELEAPAWLTRCVTNLRHFHCDDLQVELADGISIRGRNPDVLIGLGFSESICDRLLADWAGFGASSFVLVASASTPKQPANVITVDSSEPWLRSARTIGALRLIAPGDVGLSAVWVQRVARFNVGIGGVQSIGSTVDTIGNPYTWHSELLAPFKDTYSSLARLEKGGYKKAPGNLDLALRAFMSTFDRFPTAADTKLVDAVTALEAVLGSEMEIAFKLSFRVASLLAATDEQRASLLKTVKSFYDARSRIVHGGRLGQKHAAALAAIDDLRDVVRRLLRSFVLFAADDGAHVSKGFFAEELDAALVSSSRREQLRKLLRLGTAVPGASPAGQGPA